MVRKRSTSARRGRMPAEVSITIRLAAQSGRRADRSRDLGAAEPGHVGVEHDEPRRAGPAAAARASPAPRAPPCASSQTRHAPAQVREQDLAVGGVVVDDEHARRRRQDDARRAGSSARRRTTANGTGSGTRCPGRARTRRPARRPSIVDQPARDREAEPGAAEPPRGRRVGLGERLEQLRELLGRDADAGVAHLDAQQRDAVVGALGRRRAPRPRRAAVNLIALASRLVSTWRSRCSSPRSVAGHRVVDVQRRARRPSRAPAARASRRSTRPARGDRTSRCSSSSLPASILEKSSTSLITPSSASPDATAVVDAARAARRSAPCPRAARACRSRR